MDIQLPPEKSKAHFYCPWIPKFTPEQWERIMKDLKQYKEENDK